jgi:glucokinase
VSPAPVLLADIGGTHARFALGDPDAPSPLLQASVRDYRVADFPDCAAAVRHYLAALDAHPDRGVFSVAGPVDDDCVRFTNSPWVVSGRALAARLGFSSLRLVNDFTALSHALPLLGDASVQPLGGPARARFGAAAEQTFAVTGAGTGLGVGALLLREGRPVALETEGGHAGFAPCDGEQIEILRRLQARFGHVSNERLLSGQGLVNLYAALAGIAGATVEPLAPEEVTRRANAGADAQCVRAIEIFCEVFGAVAGDLVLAYGAWDGVYLGGGLTPLLLPWLGRGGFRRCFEDKGRFAARMRTVPASAVLATDAGLLGAAAFARAQGRAAGGAQPPGASRA